MDNLKSIAEIRILFAAADYVGVKTLDTQNDLIRLFNLLRVHRMAHHAARSAALPPRE
jgi:hypothetical protein